MGLEGLIKGIVYVPEIFVFLPLDLLSKPLRESKYLKGLRRIFPAIRCREHLEGGYMMCRPARKYWHPELFRESVCRYYNFDSGRCFKYLK